MRRAFLALLISLAATSVAQGRDAVAAIDACLSQMDAGLDVGYQRIAARCPDLTPSLLASPWGSWLPRDWSQPHNQLTAAGLIELRALLLRESARTAPRGELRTATVSGVLQALRFAEQPRTGWERFKSWLRELFARPQAAEDNWLQRLLVRLNLPPTLARWIIRVALAVVTILGLGIVVNELRLAGWLPPWRGGGGARASIAGGSAVGEPGLEDLERASLSQQPHLLLELVAARLTQLSRLPPARALTVRELSTAARLEAAGDRARLHELAATCERVRFSDTEVAPAMLAHALVQGRELLASLGGHGCANA
jgi:hypothetical protein